MKVKIAWGFIFLFAAILGGLYILFLVLRSQ